MGLNPRLRIACEKCNGLGVFDVHAATADDLGVCPICDGTGRDAEAEAVLAELVERLPDLADDMDGGNCAWFDDDIDVLWNLRRLLTDDTDISHLRPSPAGVDSQKVRAGAE